MLEANYFGLFLNCRRLVIVCYFGIFLVSLSLGQSVVRLRKELLSHYNKTVPPWFEDEPSDVGVFLSLTRLSQFDESTGTLSAEAYLFVNWYDSRLAWGDDPKYENISWTSAESNAIWKPGMNSFNSGRGVLYKNAEMPNFLSKNGKVWWTTAAELHALCVQDLNWYPMDTHTCKLKLGPLYPQDILIDMLLVSNNSAMHGATAQAAVNNSHWDLLSLDHEKNITIIALTMYYPTDDFTFTIRRLGRPLLATFLPLMICFVFLSWTSFLLPSRGEDLVLKRLAIATTSLFLSSTFLLVLVKTVPSVGQRPPILVKIFACAVFLEFFVCLHVIIVSKVFQNRTSTHLAALRKLPEQLQSVLGIRESIGGKGLLENEESPANGSFEQFQREPVSEDNSDLVVTAYDRVHLILQIVIILLVVAFLCLA